MLQALHVTVDNHLACVILMLLRAVMCDDEWYAMNMLCVMISGMQ